MKADSESLLPKFPITDKVAKIVILGLGLLSVGVFLVTLLLPRADSQIIGSDGRSYYSILRSLVFDQDFDFENEYEAVGFEPKPLTVTGLPENPFAMGTSLLWLPFYLTAHVMSLVLNGVGFSVSLDGYGHLHQTAVAIATIFFGTWGLWLIYRVARRLFEAEVSLIAVVVMWGATPLIHYMLAESTMSHALSFFALALFLYVWYPPFASRNRMDWLKLGLTVGLVSLVRWQDGVVAFIPLVELAWWVLKQDVRVKTAVINIFIYLLAAIFIFSPQFFMWHTLYGSPLTLPQGSDFINWLDPKPFLTLFSTRHGLITWHPVLLLALLGLIPLWKRDKALTLVILFFFIAQLYVNSAVVRWWADHAFGGRRFTGLVAFLTLPLAALLAWLRQRIMIYRFVVGLLLFMIFMNGLLMIQFTFEFISRSDSLTWRELTIGRFQVIHQLMQLLQR
jgi:hypothetical protein